MTGRLPKESSAAGSASESASCGPERLLFVVAGGEVTWDEATQRFDPDRSDAALPVLTQPGVLPTEPLYVDVTGDAPWHPAAPLFREKVTDLAAPIHGKPKDELAGEDRREQRRFRRLRRIAIVSLVLLTVIAVTAGAIAWIQRKEAVRQRNEAVALALAAASSDVGKPTPHSRSVSRLRAAAPHPLRCGRRPAP
jgi:hypothetical protein